MAKRVFILNADRESVLNAIRTAKDGFKVTLEPAGRSIPQNSLSHEIYALIAQALPEDDPIGWKAYCKLQFGVPILRAEDAEFREFYDGNIKKSFSYEQKLKAMKYLPVTSLMNKEQKSRYLDEVIAHFTARGVQL